MRFARRAVSVLLMLTATPALSSEDHATLAQFEQALAAQPSATRVLQEWCAARGMADPARITAQRLTSGGAPPPHGLHAALDMADGEEASYRHVRLNCGATTLSEAHNWYVRARLTPEMNAALDSTDTPFGTVAAPLRFTRQPLDSHHGAQGGCPAGTVLTHRALLRLPDGRPLALLVECYTREILRVANPPPAR